MRRAKKLGIAIASALLVAVVIVAVGGWYLSNLLRDGGLVPDYEDPEFDLELVSIGEGRVTLRITPETDEDGDWEGRGTFGLEWDTGYAQVGRILQLGEEQVVREYSPLAGDPGAGEMVRVDGFAFPDDPEKAFGLPFEQVSYSSQLGSFPAWLVAGTAETWVIFVHGKGAERREALRMLPTVARLGLPALIITYRNGEDLPADSSGFYRYGLTEWRDLEGAAKYAIEHGAASLILVGYSMGGAIVTSFLYESPLAPKVRGAILDAPMLDFSQTVDLGASERGYPQILSSLAKAFAGFRFDIDWGKIDYLKRTDELDLPILLFHGDADTTVPVETSEALAEARPDIVEYVLVGATRHVRAWNTDPAAYEARVREFLLDLTQ